MKRTGPLALLSALLALAALCPSAVFAETGAVIRGGEGSSFSVSEERLLSLGLPVLSLDTADGDYITSRLEYKSARMRIALTKEYAGETNLYTGAEGGAVRVKGRGNSTWNNGYPDGKENTLRGDTHTRKVPYTLKLDKKADLFGLGRSKNWVLVGNYMDRTLLRGKLIYDYSARLGMTAVPSVFLNLVLNGEYMGVYQLCRKIDADLFDGEVTDWGDVAEDAAAAVARAEGLTAKQREALETELKENAAWITGGKTGGYRIADYFDLSAYDPYTGFLMEYDRYADEPSFFVTGHDVPLKVKNLDAIKTNGEMYLRLRRYFIEFEEALFSPDFCNSKGKHYSEYLDMDRFVDYFLLNMVMLNLEFGYKSTFFCLNGEGKIVFGPCWDYDWSSGNLFLKAKRSYDSWYADGRSKNNHWYHQAYRDPWFIALVRERWAQIRETVPELLAEIDRWEMILAPTEALEYRKFANDPYETDFAKRTGGRSYLYETADLRRFLEQRIGWMDAQLSLRDPRIEDRGYEKDVVLALSVTGTEAEIAPAAGEGFYVADGISPLLQDVSLSLTLKRADTVSLYLNGKLLIAAKVTDPAEKVALTVPADRLDPGINVLTAIRAGGEGRSVYFSLRMPGEKRAAEGDPGTGAAPETGQPAETAGETETGGAPGASGTSEGVPSFLFFLLPVAAAAAVSVALFVGKKTTKNRGKAE